MQKWGLFALISLCQDSINVTQDVSFHLSIIADGVANVSGCEHVNPYKLTLLGISQVLPKEYEKARCQLIDINTNVKDEINIDSILYELATNNNSEVALRGLRRFIKDYARIKLGEEFLGHNILEATKNYLIIGGLGNFGMELAEFIGAVNKGRVFLTTRINFPKLENWDLWLAEKGLENSISKKILYLKGIMQKGADINILKGDVTNRYDLEAIKHYIEQNYGSINGVIHAAGIVESGMLQHKTRESLNNVFAAKIQGTENVCKVFLPSKPDFIILCSSMNAIIGGLGQIDNTAANAFVDGYAEYCLNNGHDNVLAINWGAVNEARARNYSALPQFAELSREHIKNRMTKDETFDVYRRIFSSKILPRIVISTIDFNEVVKNWNRVGSLQALLRQVDCHKKDRQEVVQNEYKVPNSSMEVQIAKLWQELLGINQVGLKDNFFELGGNSLIAIQFIGKLTNQYPIKMHAMSIYEYPSLLEFSAYVEQLVREAQEKQQLIDG
ncbi:SDR family NAD(P)-dependent oxidoreductase [Rickettsia tamurae]|nr:SDR family NAD(P)-dependent oxidoreductase [Rickettsia tamurae]